MPTKLFWSNHARADLLDIYVLIELEQPAAAERYFDRIEEKIPPAAIATPHGRAAP
jgi:toxin ParE1/3/4